MVDTLRAYIKAPDSASPGIDQAVAADDASNSSASSSTDELLQFMMPWLSRMAGVLIKLLPLMVSRLPLLC